MFKITDSTFYVSRKENRSFNIQVENYLFQAGDKVVFRVYEANGFEDESLLEKSEVLTESNVSTLTFTLTEADTNFGGETSEVVDYWYEIKLNDTVVLAGYDTDGPKIFKLYPTGKDRV